MKILVINGSPKGEYSITLQTVRYLGQQYPDQTFEVLHVGARIRSYEKDFAPARQALEAAELLLSNRDYYDHLNQNDLNFRMQKADATLEELEAFAAAQTLDLTDAEKGPSTSV